VESSSIAESSAFASVLPSPTPMFSVIFDTRGTSMIEALPSSSLRSTRRSSSYRRLRRGM